MFGLISLHFVGNILFPCLFEPTSLLQHNHKHLNYELISEMLFDQMFCASIALEKKQQKSKAMLKLKVQRSHVVHSNRRQNLTTKVSRLRRAHQKISFVTTETSSG